MKRKKKEHEAARTEDETEMLQMTKLKEAGVPAGRKGGGSVGEWGCGSQVEHSQYDSMSA